MAHVQKRYEQYTAHTKSLEVHRYVKAYCWQQVYVKLFHSSADSNVLHNYTGCGARGVETSDGTWMPWRGVPQAVLVGLEIGQDMAYHTLCPKVDHISLA